MPKNALSQSLGTNEPEVGCTLADSHYSIRFSQNCKDETSSGYFVIPQEYIQSCNIGSPKGWWGAPMASSESLGKPDLELRIRKAETELNAPAPYVEINVVKLDGECHYHSKKEYVSEIKGDFQRLLSAGGLTTINVSEAQKSYLAKIDKRGEQFDFVYITSGKHKLDAFFRCNPLGCRSPYNAILEGKYFIDVVIKDRQIEELPELLNEIKAEIESYYEEF